MVTFLQGRWPSVLLLLFGLLFVGGLDTLWGGQRYPYAADSASYLDMAESLRSEGQPRVTPWGYDEASGEASIPQRLFPPGYPLMIAAVATVTGDVQRAALWVVRTAALLLPALVFLLFRGVLPDRILLVFAAYVLMTPGVRGWQFLAYSDVPALALSILALGALVRGLGLVGDSSRRLGWCVLAGAAAGSAYAVRNAALAVLAILLVLLVDDLRRTREVRRGVAVLVGAAAPLAMLFTYNLKVFGQVQPYTMPASTRPWSSNVADYAHAQLVDLGVPWQWVDRLHPAVPLVVVALAYALIGRALVRPSVDVRRRALVLLTGGYAAGGALLLIASRSRFEWGNVIDERNTLQLTWALAFAVLLSLSVLLRKPVQASVLRGLLAFVGLVATASIVDAVGVASRPAEVWQRLNADTPMLDRVRTLPADTYIASNEAVLFRIGAHRRVREFEIGGDDRDLQAALMKLGAQVPGRPTALVVVCDEYTPGFSVCGGRAHAAVVPPDCPVIRAEPPRVALCRSEPAS